MIKQVIALLLTFLTLSNGQCPPSNGTNTDIIVTTISQINNIATANQSLYLLSIPFFNQPYTIASWVVHLDYDNTIFTTRTPFFKDFSFELNGTFQANSYKENIYILNSTTDYQTFVYIINNITESLKKTLEYSFEGFGTYPITSYNISLNDLPISCNEYDFLYNYYNAIYNGDVIKATLFVINRSFIDPRELSTLDTLIFAQAKSRVYTPGQQVLYFQQLNYW